MTANQATSAIYHPGYVTSSHVSAPTMNSRDIAALTGKDHKHVLADIRNMLDTLGLTSAEFSANLPDAYGRLQT